MVLKTPTNLLAGNERTGGRGGNAGEDGEEERAIAMVRRTSREGGGLMTGQGRGGGWTRGRGGVDER